MKSDARQTKAEETVPDPSCDASVGVTFPTSESTFEWTSYACASRVHVCILALKTNVGLPEA